MSTVIGIRRSAQVAANVTFTTNVTLATIGLLSALPAGQSQHIRAWIPFTVGATGGVRAQIVVPAGGSVFIASIVLYNTVAPSTTTAAQTSSAAFTNALANAGTHWLAIEASIVNGSTAGSIDIQAAQNTSDANTLTVLRGGWMDVTIF